MTPVVPTDTTLTWPATEDAFTNIDVGTNIIPLAAQNRTTHELIATLYSISESHKPHNNRENTGISQNTCPPRHPTHLLGGCPNVYAFTVLSVGRVAGELKVVNAAVLDDVVGYVSIHDEVLQTNALPPARRCRVVVVIEFA